MNSTDYFNIRVYGLFLNERNEILLADEFQMDMNMTKFPGGGMKIGEGTRECLIREGWEEFGQEIVVLDHFYTTDFCQVGVFPGSGQIVSIYYYVRFCNEIGFPVANQPTILKELKNGNISFRWRQITEIQPDELTFPIDKTVIQLLKKKWRDGAQ